MLWCWGSGLTAVNWRCWTSLWYNVNRTASLWEWRKIRCNSHSLPQLLLVLPVMREGLPGKQLYSPLTWIPHSINRDNYCRCVPLIFNLQLRLNSCGNKHNGPTSLLNQKKVKVRITSKLNIIIWKSNTRVRINTRIF